MTTCFIAQLLIGWASLVHALLCLLAVTAKAKDPPGKESEDSQQIRNEPSGHVHNMESDAQAVSVLLRQYR